MSLSETKRAYNKKWRREHAERVRELHRNWIKANPDKYKEQRRRIREKHGDKIRKYMREWARAHPPKDPDRRNAVARLWRARNPEKVKVNQKRARDKQDKAQVAEYMKRYAIANRARLLAYRSEYWKARRSTDMNAKMRARLSARFHGLLKRPRIKVASTMKLLGCTMDEFRVHLERQFKDGMSWQNWGLWEIDHIRPCASFDLSDPEQQKACFHYTNLQPLWESDNRSKGAKLLHDRIAAAKVQMNGTGAPNGIGNQT